MALNPCVSKTNMRKEKKERIKERQNKDKGEMTEREKNCYNDI